MKKLYGIILIGLTVLLFSCGQESTGTQNIADKPSSELNSVLKLDTVTKALNTYVATDSSYQAVNVSTNINDSLFTYSVNLDDLFESQGDRVLSANVECLTFVSGISSDYQANLYSYLKNSESGLTKDLLGVSFDLMVNSWSSSVSLKEAYNEYNNGTKNQTLAIVYMPVHFTVVESSTQKLSAYVMVPVYYGLTQYSRTFANSIFDSFDLLSKTDLKIADGSKILGSAE